MYFAKWYKSPFLILSVHSRAYKIYNRKASWILLKRFLCSRLPINTWSSNWMRKSKTHFRLLNNCWDFGYVYSQIWIFFSEIQSLFKCIADKICKQNARCYPKGFLNLKWLFSFLHISSYLAIFLSGANISHISRNYCAILKPVWKELPLPSFFVFPPLRKPILSLKLMIFSMTLRKRHF